LFPVSTPNVPSQTKISLRAAGFNQLEFVSLDGLGLKKKEKKTYLKQFTAATAPRDTGQPVGLDPIHTHLSLRLTSELDSNLASQILFCVKR